MAKRKKHVSKRSRKSAPRKRAGKRGRKKGYKHSAATKRKIAAAARARYRAGKNALVRVNVQRLGGKRHHKGVKHPRREYASLEERARARHARRHNIKFKPRFVPFSKPVHRRLVEGAAVGPANTPYMRALRARLKAQQQGKGWFWGLN